MRSHLKGEGIVAQTAMMLVGAASLVIGMATRATTGKVTTASASVTRSPTRTPPSTPWAAIKSPPSVGASAIGTRFRMDCTVKPRARRSLGRVSPTTEKRVGLAMLDHAMTKTRPRKTNGQVGASQ